MSKRDRLWVESIAENYELHAEMAGIADGYAGSVAHILRWALEAEEALRDMDTIDTTGCSVCSYFRTDIDAVLARVPWEASDD